jgi:hypothetical protein
MRLGLDSTIQRRAIGQEEKRREEGRRKEKRKGKERKANRRPVEGHISVYLHPPYA